MSEKSKLYIFDKKEIFLIFLFMILASVSSFMIGVKIGKSYSFKEAGFTDEDQKTIDIYSSNEEDVAKVVEKREVVDPEHKKKTIDSTYDKLKEEFAKLGDDKKKLDEPKVKSDPTKKDVLDIPEAVEKKNVDTKESTTQLQTQDIGEEKVENIGKPADSENNDEFAGKYTIQLASYPSKEEAIEFANGFKIRGYNPIVSAAEIPSRGTWYRVSIGVFDTVSESKDYILKERSLFEGQDYRIRKFD